MKKIVGLATTGIAIALILMTSISAKDLSEMTDEESDEYMRSLGIPDHVLHPGSSSSMSNNKEVVTAIVVLGLIIGVIIAAKMSKHLVLKKKA